MGTENIHPEQGSLDASGDFPVGDRSAGDGSVSEERHRRVPAPSPSNPGESNADIVVLGPPLQAGQLIAGKYRLKRTIGEGGMGLVWIARNEDLDADVAIKVLRPESRKSVRAQVAERMLVEARAAARLGHPAIVRVLDLGRTADGDPFLVMELLEGENLADVVETRGPMDAVEAVKTLLPIAHAMVAAHERNIIHRDLKPENIILSVQQGGSMQPKLIDFGVAKLATEEADKITQIGMLVGSPGYMSPEQGRGDVVDARSDVWSFCIVLHELVTGQVPFRKNHPYAILRAILEEQLPDLAEAGFHDEALAAIVRRGLEKEAEDRWQSMQELGVTLARWLLDKGEFDDICGASLDVTWLRPRLSVPEGLAAFRERSPSLAALARMRETTRDSSKPAMPVSVPVLNTQRLSQSDEPVAMQPVAPSFAPPKARKGALWIAIGGVVVALSVIGGLVYLSSRSQPSSGALSTPTNAALQLPASVAAPKPVATDVASSEPKPDVSAHAGDHAKKPAQPALPMKPVAPVAQPSSPAVTAAPQAPSVAPPPPAPVDPSPLKRPDL